jgi:hypothetical protein
MYKVPRSRSFRADEDKAVHSRDCESSLNFDDLLPIIRRYQDQGNCLRPDIGPEYHFINNHISNSNYTVPEKAGILAWRVHIAKQFDT